MIRRKIIAAIRKRRLIEKELKEVKRKIKLIERRQAKIERKLVKCWKKLRKKGERCLERKNSKKGSKK